MDKTALVAEVADLLRISDHEFETSVEIHYREIDVVAKETAGLSRKTLLIECADYSAPVGVAKLQEDIAKLTAARSSLRGAAVVMHVSRLGYSPHASGLARDEGIDAVTLDELRARLVNFER